MTFKSPTFWNMLYEFHKSFDGKSIKWRQIEHAIHSFQILKENKLLFVNINVVGIYTYSNIGYDLKIKKNIVKQKKSALKSSMSKSMVPEYAVWLNHPPYPYTLGVSDMQSDLNRHPATNPSPYTLEVSDI